MHGSGSILLLAKAAFFPLHPPSPGMNTPLSPQKSSPLFRKLGRDTNFLLSPCLLSPPGYTYGRFLEIVLDSTSYPNDTKHSLMMTGCHRDIYYICVRIYILTYVTTAHAVHTTSPLLLCRDSQGVLCYQLCCRGKVLKQLWSCGKNPAVLGVQRWNWWTVLSPLKRST